MTGLSAAGLIVILKDGKPRQEIDLVAGQSLSMGKYVWYHAVEAQSI